MQRAIGWLALLMAIGVSNCSGAHSSDVDGAVGGFSGAVSNGSNGGATGSASATGGASASGGSGGSSSSGGTHTGGTSAGSCLGAQILNAFGKTHVLVGAAAKPATLDSTPFDLRYQYLSGGLFDGSSPCASCANACTAAGVSCANGCGWWGCWQNPKDPPGVFVHSYAAGAAAKGQVPMFTYYEILHTSRASEGRGEVQATTNVGLMTRYLNDWRFVLKQVGQTRALLHIEPDFWGYAEQLGTSAHSIPSAVASANPTDCASQENSIAGLGRCMIAMVRKYAPKALVGLHASDWGTLTPALSNTKSDFDVVGVANKLGDFMLECGAGDGDVIIADLADRDAGWRQTQGQNTWWDPTNASLPNFHQANTWAKALAERVKKGFVWWQVPVGNMSLPNVTNQWKDNRVDYFFGHMNELAASHVIAVAYGSGAGDQTQPETDGGNLVNKTKAYAAAGGRALCP